MTDTIQKYLVEREKLIEAHAYNPLTSMMPAASALWLRWTASRAAKSSRWASRP
jgi:hypothetical protein